MRDALSHNYILKYVGNIILNFLSTLKDPQRPSYDRMDME